MFGDGGDTERTTTMWGKKDYVTGVSRWGWAGKGYFRVKRCPQNLGGGKCDRRREEKKLGGGRGGADVCQRI